MSNATLVKRLLAAKEAYYNDEPTLTDEAFDALEDELRKADPKNDYFKIVGASVGNSKTKVKHEIPMLSCGKAKEPAEVVEWAGKHGVGDESLLIQPKIDGLSCAAIYEKGKLVMVKTRGDGHIGQNITHVAAHVNIPATIDKREATRTVEIRGELYLPKNTKLPNPESKPLRNLAVGLVNRKGHGLEDLKFIHFVAYQVHGASDRIGLESNKMEWLKDNAFETVWSELTTINGIAKSYSTYLSRLRTQWNYETDGLVITVNDNSLWNEINRRYEVSHHNHYNIALKPPSEGKETTLLDIEWNVSRQGKLIPVALVKPVVLGGATVQRCTLNNFGNVEALKLHKGDKVVIERANDVIPFFKENLTPHDKFKGDICPMKCTSCGGALEVDGIHIVCNNFCEEQEILKVVHWVKACDMEFFAESSIRALFKAKAIDTIADLYDLNEKHMRGLEGFGASRIKNALEQIEQTKEMTIGAFVDRLGIDLVGEKAMKKMGITTEMELWAFKDRTYVIGQNLIDYLKANKASVVRLLSKVKIIKEKALAKGASKVCMTGSGPKTRNELIGDISAKGDVFVDHVSKDTDLLICEDINGASSKLQKATKMGVKLISYKDYFK